MSEPPFSRTAHHGRDSSPQNIHTAAPDSLAGALTFTAQRFVAIATELDEARAKLAAVEAALLMGGQSADVRCRAALIALGHEQPPDEVLFRTPDEWCELFGLIVLDPDGWRLDGQSWDQPITREEFNRRGNMSTIGPSR